jgi:hypothetical protein
MNKIFFSPDNAYDFSGREELLKLSACDGFSASVGGSCSENGRY